MFAAIVQAVRSVFAPATTGRNAGWSDRFLSTDRQDLQRERDVARFNPARDLCW